VLADLDGDGALDHVAAVGKKSLRVAFGSGGGGFAPSIEVQVSMPASRVAASDVDGDGDWDLLVVGVVSGSWDSSLVFLRNDGGGSFAAPVETYVGKSAYALRLGDFDVDGKVDVAIGVDGGMSVLLSDGTGAFQPLFAPDIPKYTVAAADFDLDGAPDLGARATGVQFYRNDGTGAFEPPVTTPYGEDNRLLEAGDYDTDGAPDLVTTVLAPGSTDTRVQAILNVGGGSFAPAPIVSVSEGERAAAIRPADTDGDGSLDVVLTTTVIFGGPSPEDPPALVWARGDGSGGFTGSSHPIGPTGAPLEIYSHGLALGDVDGDSELDAVALASDTFFVVFPGDGAGGFHGSEVAAEIDDVTSGALADLDGDGYLDLAAAVYPTKLAIALGDGDGAFLAPAVYDLGAETKNLVPLDWDGDLDLDLLGVTQHGQVGLFAGDGTGAIALGDAVDLDAENVSDTLHGDFDGDGAQDLVVLISASAYAGRLVKRDATGGLAWGMLDLCQSGTCTFIMGGDAGDVDLDGALDLVLVRWEIPYIGGRLDTYLGNGAGAFAFAATTTGLDPSAMDVHLVELNSDAYLDAVLPGYVTDTALGDGAGAFIHHTSLPTEDQGIPPGPLVLADVAGDGRTDLVRGYGGVWLGDGTAAPSLQGIYSWPGINLLAGDVDADGARDVVTFNGSRGEVYLTEGLTGCAGEIAAYGLASPGSGGFAPSLTVTGCASPGGTLRVRLEDALGGAPALIALGKAESHVPFLNGYELLVGQVVAAPPISLTGVVAGSGAAEIVATLGGSTAGAFLTLQAFVLDPGATGSVASTNAVRIAVH
jgi:hypothetical protein